MTGCGCAAGAVLRAQSCPCSSGTGRAEGGCLGTGGHSLSSARILSSGSELSWAQALLCGALFVLLYFVDAVLRTNSILKCGAQGTEGEFCHASTKESNKYRKKASSCHQRFIF